MVDLASGTGSQPPPKQNHSSLNRPREDVGVGPASGSVCHTAHSSLSFLSKRLSLSVHFVPGPGLSVSLLQRMVVPSEVVMSPTV